jgi:hypothetical protein
MDDGYVRDLGFIGALEFFSNVGLEFVYWVARAGMGTMGSPD